MGLAGETQEKRKPNLLIAITLSTLLILWLATGFAMTQKHGRGAGSSPPSTQGNANQQTTAQQQEKKSVVLIKNTESPANTNVTITANESLNDYRAYRSGDRYYVVIPNADVPRGQSNVHGRGYADMQVQKRGNDIVLSFRLQPGAKPLVRQKFNRLEVVFNTPGAAAKAVTTNGNTNPTVTSPPINGSGTTRERMSVPLAKRPLRKEQLIQALRVGGVSSNEYVKRIRERGVDFELTQAIEREFRAAGASSAVIEAVRANYRPPATFPTSNPEPPQTAPQIEMVLIPAGTFMMGSPDGVGSSFEHPQHRVTVQSFYMGKYEVTQAQYHAVMGTNPSHFKGDNLPVEWVLWNDAVKFCRKLSQITGREYRLPSEAEWEYACRAGTTTEFTFGDSLSSEQANFDGNYPYGGAAKGVFRFKATPVGSFQPNAFGLYDMHGNVSEWCEDIWHENYNGAPSDGSAWLSDGDSSYRMVRGGSWNSNSYDLRSADRNRYYPRNLDLNLGFRVVAGSRSS